MSARVLIVGAPHDVAEALRTMRGYNLRVVADPTLVASALDEMRAHGHQVVEDTRMAQKILLELPPRDLRRLRMLKADDESNVLAAARRAIHDELEMLVIPPACAGCAPTS